LSKIPLSTNVDSAAGRLQRFIRRRRREQRCPTPRRAGDGGKIVLAGSGERFWPQLAPRPIEKRYRSPAPPYSPSWTKFNAAPYRPAVANCRGQNDRGASPGRSAGIPGTGSLQPGFPAPATDFPSLNRKIPCFVAQGILALTTWRGGCFRSGCTPNSRQSIKNSLQIPAYQGNFDNISGRGTSFRLSVDSAHTQSRVVRAEAKGGSVS
jgi:hypothetical protein